MGVNQPKRKRELLSRGEDKLQRIIRDMLPESVPLDLDSLTRSLQPIVSEHGEAVFANLIDLLFHISLSPKEAKRHWDAMIRHHVKIQSKLKENIDFRVTALDYLTRITNLMSNPRRKLLPP